MPQLPSDLRRQLENVCVQARELAEAAARSVLMNRAVDAAEPVSHFTAVDKELRKAAELISSDDYPGLDRTDLEQLQGA